MAEAVERGLARREAAGEDVSRMSPVITIMVGRLDDWMGVLVARDGLVVNPGVVHWAGIAAFKRAYVELPEARVSCATAGRRVSSPPALVAS